MRLLTAHKILIIAASALGLILAIWSIWRWRAQGDSGWLPLGGAGAVLSVLLLLYLRAVVKKYSDKIG
jgi:hypothetical protein